MAPLNRWHWDVGWRAAPHFTDINQVKPSAAELVDCLRRSLYASYPHENNVYGRSRVGFCHVRLCRPIPWPNLAAVDKADTIRSPGDSFP